MRKAYRIMAALALAVLPFAAQAQKNIDTLRAQYDSLGNTSGAFLFPKSEGANLRIMDINVWEWDGTREKLPKAWKEAGEDCTNEVRSKGFAGIVKAYLPEIICLQEYSPEMHAEFYPQISKDGYKITFVPDSANFTPVFYNKSKLKLLHTSYHPHARPYNNGDTK